MLETAAATPFDRLDLLVATAAARSPAHRVSGRVVRISTTFLVVSGLSKFVSIGDAVSIYGLGGTVLAEVATIEADTINVTPFIADHRIELGARVTTMTGPMTLSPHESWLGRTINALGEPIDGGDALVRGERAFAIQGTPPSPLRRSRLGTPLITGVKAIDLFTPICAGQRLGIFAGSGVGKSTLLAMLSRAPSCDVTVLALVGERSREVRDFLDDTLGETRSRVVSVVSTSDESPMMRRLAPATAMCIAEYYRDRGQNVLLIIDSLTRYAHAMRELALAADEPPVARGYPPSVFSNLPRLLERAGPGEEGAGTITAILSVLVDGDDHNDPIADTTRGILDGHIVLDRGIASQGRLPAVDPLASLSRLAPKIRTKNQAQFVTQLIEVIARYEDTRDLRAIGGYKSGSDAVLDRAMEIVPRVYEAIKQNLDDPPVEDVFGYLSQTLQSGGNRHQR
ncbi:FliI/YscN family ATPase [Hyphomicrobium sp.]|uniref:FliI/YscN family ATPase n=1 Tax=Hyphomicrobium sp. TaxID=82 RepID=UPI000F9A19EB|nr:FliI/YscN family ATPase [Hyphomicrobium sp.]RUO98700.1 MAG: flagellar protein export ATPase FliI [Hyphomicrobium sp.]